MSEFKVNNITDSAGTGSPNFSQGVDIAGSDITNTITVMSEYYSQSSEPSSPANGAVWYDTSTGKTYQYLDSLFYEISFVPLPIGDRGLMGSGRTYTTTNLNLSTFDYVDINTTGDSTDFGEISYTLYLGAAVAGGGRAVIGGGIWNETSSSAETITMEYFTIATPSNSTDFGDLTDKHTTGPAGISDATYGLFCAGFNSAGQVSNRIDYITIATTGNSADFGDLITERWGTAGCGNTDRGLIGNGRNYANGYLNSIEYVTPSVPGNATDFGDMGVSRIYIAACANSTRGLFAGGGLNDSSNAVLNTIEYVTIATPGNATDFGDLRIARNAITGCANSTRGLFIGGRTDSTIDRNEIDYVTIDTLGNAADFGNFKPVSGFWQNNGAYWSAACSGD